MKTQLTFVIFPLLLSKILSTCDVITEEEAEIISANLHLMEINHCILVSESKNEKLKNAIKTFTDDFIFTGIMSLDKLKEFIKKMKPPDFVIAVVIKVPKSVVLRELFTENFERLFWFTWFLISEDVLDEKIKIPFNCLFLIIRKNINGTYKILENYHIKNSSTFINDFGSWSLQRGLKVTPLSFYGRRKNMKKIELVRTDSENNVKCNKYILEKEAKKVWQDLSKILNFTLRVVDDSLKTNSSKNLPDASTCIFGIGKNDFHRDWIFSYFGIKIRIVTKFRGSNEIGWRAYARPFKNEIWTALGAWLAISTVAVIIIEGCSRKSWHRHIFTSFFCMCNSDPLATHPPNEAILFPTKVVYLMMLVIPSVIIPAYSAYILATLSIVLPVVPFATLQNFISDGTFKLSTVNNTFLMRFLKTSEDPDIKYINDNFLVNPNESALSFLHLFDQLCKDNQLAGLFVDSKNFRSFFPCRMYVMQPEVITLSCGFLLQKGSPIRKLFNEMFSQHKEKGLMYRIENVNEKFPPYLGNSEKGSEKLSSLTMVQTSAIFLLVPLGVILSSVVLAVEIALHKKQIQEKRKRWRLEIQRIDF